MRRLDKQEKMLYNTVVEAKDEKHAKRIVKLYREKGYSTNGYTGTCWTNKCTGESTGESTYYGVIDGQFGMYNTYDFVEGVEIVKLPKKNNEKHELKRLRNINKQLQLQLGEVESMNERLNEQMEDVRKAIS